MTTSTIYLLLSVFWLVFAFFQDGTDLLIMVGISAVCSTAAAILRELEKMENK